MDPPKKILLTYCPNNPARHESDAFERLSQDGRFELKSPYCRNMCREVCTPTLYAIVGEGKVGEKMVQGTTEAEFLQEIEKATGVDMSKYREESK